MCFWHYMYFFIIGSNLMNAYDNNDFYNIVVLNEINNIYLIENIHNTLLFMETI